MHAGTAIESFRTLLRGKIMKRFTLVRDPTCALSVERAIAGMQTFGGTRKGKTHTQIYWRGDATIDIKHRCQGKEGGLKVGEVESQRVEEEVELVQCDVARNDEKDHLEEEEEAKYQIVFVDPGPSRGGRDNEVPQVASEQVVVAS